MSNQKPLTFDGVAVSLVRATADKHYPCRFCRCATFRTITFKRHGDPSWDILWACDACLGGIKNLDWVDQGM